MDGAVVRGLTPTAIHVPSLWDMRWGHVSPSVNFRVLRRVRGWPAAAIRLNAVAAKGDPAPGAKYPEGISSSSPAWPEASGLRRGNGQNEINPEGGCIQPRKARIQPLWGWEMM